MIPPYDLWTSTLMLRPGVGWGVGAVMCSYFENTIDSHHILQLPFKNHLFCIFHCPQVLHANTWHRQRHITPLIFSLYWHLGESAKLGRFKLVSLILCHKDAIVLVYKLSLWDWRNYGTKAAPCSPVYKERKECKEQWRPQKGPPYFRDAHCSKYLYKNST